MRGGGPNLEVYEAACRYVAAGLSVVPTGVRGEFAKHPHYRALKATGHSYLDEEGRPRATWRTFQHQRPTPEELHAWFVRLRVEGVSLVTGSISGLVCLDFDAGAGIALLRQLGWEPHVLTPGGGAHVYLPHPGWPVPTTNAFVKRSLPEGLDVRGDGGLAVLPPTVTDRGPYRRTRERALLPLAAVPERLYLGAREYRLRELCGLVCPPQDVPREEARPPRVSAPRLEGQVQDEGERVPSEVLVRYALSVAASRGRNIAGYWLARQLNDNGFERREAVELGPHWVGEANERTGGCNVKGEAEAYTLDHFLASVRSAYRQEPRRAWQRQARASDLVQP